MGRIIWTGAGIIEFNCEFLNDISEYYRLQYKIKRVINQQNIYNR